jgi:hypothetical protein
MTVYAIHPSGKVERHLDWDSDGWSGMIYLGTLPQSGSACIYADYEIDTILGMERPVYATASWSNGSLTICRLVVDDSAIDSEVEEEIIRVVADNRSGGYHVTLVDMRTKPAKTYLFEPKGR